MMAMEEARPLNEVRSTFAIEGREKRRRNAYVVMTSWNNHIPKSEAATPRTAEETICVIGEVTLIDKRLAILMRNPSAP